MSFDEMVERFVRERQATIRRESEQTRRAAQSTYDAVLWVLREYGVARLGNDWTVRRLAEFSPEQLRELIAAMHRLKATGWTKVTDELIAELGAML
jgi:phage terminase large subunit